MDCARLLPRSVGSFGATRQREAAHRLRHDVRHPPPLEPPHRLGGEAQGAEVFPEGEPAIAAEHSGLPGELEPDRGLGHAAGELDLRGA